MSRHKYALKSQSSGRSVKRHPGVEGRSLLATPQHLLLHPEEFNQASKEDVQAVAKYVSEKRWKSLYRLDRWFPGSKRIPASEQMFEREHLAFDLLLL